MSRVKITDLSDLWIGEVRRVQVQGNNLVVIRTSKGVFAYADKCPHLGFPLSAGELRESTLTCAAHGWQFNASTGQGINPANEELMAYEVEIRNEQVWITIP